MDAAGNSAALAALAAIEDNSDVRVTLQDGRTMKGRLQRAQGVPFVSCQGDTLVFHPASPDTAALVSIAVVKDAATIAAENADRKYGAIAYTQPTTRAEYEAVLWDLARQIAECKTESYNFGDAHLKQFRRGMQLEAQFNYVADQIALAKGKRRYMRSNSMLKARGEPLQTIGELLPIGTANGYQVSVPKPTDFDPDPVVRRKRSPRPAEDYYRLGELQESIRDAREKAALTRSRPRRERMLAIVAAREKQIARGEYYEARAAALVGPSAGELAVETAVQEQAGQIAV